MEFPGRNSERPRGHLTPGPSLLPKGRPLASRHITHALLPSVAPAAAEQGNGWQSPRPISGARSGIYQPLVSQPNVPVNEICPAPSRTQVVAPHSDIHD